MHNNAHSLRLVVICLIAGAFLTQSLATGPVYADCQFGQDYPTDLRCFLNQFGGSQCYDSYFGFSGPPNFSEALQCFENNKIWSYLVVMYLNGQGGPRDVQKAEQWFATGQKMAPIEWPGGLSGGEVSSLKQNIEKARSTSDKDWDPIDHQPVCTSAVASLQLLFGALAVEDRPQVTRPDAVVRGRAAGRAVGRVWLVAVTVAVGRSVGLDAVAMPAGTPRRLALEDRVDDLERGSDLGVARRQLTEPSQLKEAGVDHAPLIDVVEAAVVEVIGLGGVRVSGRRETDEVAMVAIRAGIGDSRGLHVALVVVGGRLVEQRPRGVAGCLGEMGGGGQPGDLGCDRRRRVCDVLLPAVLALGRPVGDDEVSVGPGGAARRRTYCLRSPRPTPSGAGRHPRRSRKGRTCPERLIRRVRSHAGNSRLAAVRGRTGTRPSVGR